MKIYLDNNLGVTNVEQEELTQDTIGYNILKVYIPNTVLTPYNVFTCYYGALLQNGRKVGWFAMEARTSSDADYEANYTLYKATLEQCVVSVEGKVYIGCQVLLGNSGNATLIKKNTAVVQFNVRKSVAINNDILVLDTDQTTTDVLESYKQLLENALVTYATKAEVYTQAQVNALLLQKADKSDTYTKSEVYSKTETNALLDTKADKSTTYTKTQVDIALATKADRDATDSRFLLVESAIDDLTSVQNVVDIVPTYSALQSYDTSKLDANDKVQVIADETHDGASTIYNWSGSAWQYVGAFGGNSYTKQESDNKFATKATAITNSGNQLQDYSGNNIYPILEDGSIDLDKLSENVILSYGYVLQTLNWQVGGINTSTGAVNTGNTMFIHSDFINISNLLFLKGIESVTALTNLEFYFFKYKLDGSYLGYDGSYNLIDENYIKVMNYDNIKIRLCVGFVSPRNMNNQQYYDYAVARFDLYTNNYYTSNIIDNKINNIISDIDNKKYVFERPNFYSKESYYVPSNRYDYNTILGSRIDINISRNGHKWGTDFNIKQHTISNENGVTIYMSPNGDDSNDGLTPDTPKLTLSSCLSVTNVDTIILESGIYYMGIHFTSNQSISQPVNIICNEWCYFVNGDKITTCTDMGNGYYLIPRGSNGVGRLYIDIESGEALKDVTSTTDMSFYTIYKGSSAAIVRLPYRPNSNKLVRTNNAAPIIIENNCYIEGICFIGGHQALNVSLTNINLYLSHCKFLYARNNGLRVLGGNVYIYKCEASYNYLDGFNYHPNTDEDVTRPHILEIECCGYYNGYLNFDDTLYSNNGSTIHYSGKAIRLNCEYAYCKGGVIADHTASSFNFGCSSHNSVCYVSGSETNNASIHCIAQSTMYLFDCILYGSKYEISMVQGNGTINTNIEYNKIYQEDSTEIINIIQ